MKRVLAFCLMLVLFAGMLSTNVGFAETLKENTATPADALTTRLVHMLELNYNFDKDFKNDEIILENALIALSGKADEDGFVDTALLNSFLTNMYGYTVDTADYSADKPKKDNCVWVIPKGYTNYSYTACGISYFDGGLTLTARVFADYHDADAEVFYVTVDFIENSDSCFGYNIASCVTVKDIGYRI